MKQQQAQSTVEFVVLIAMVVLAFFGTWHAMRGAMVGYWRGLSGGEVLYAPEGRTSGTETTQLTVRRTDTVTSVKCDPDTEDCGPSDTGNVAPGQERDGNEITRYTTFSKTDQSDTDVTVNTQVNETYDKSRTLFQ